MPVARIITRRPEAAASVARDLSNSGYKVAIVSPESPRTGYADLEIDLDRDHPFELVAEPGASAADVSLNPECFDSEHPHEPEREFVLAPVWRGMKQRVALWWATLGPPPKTQNATADAAGFRPEPTPQELPTHRSAEPFEIQQSYVEPNEVLPAGIASQEVATMDVAANQPQFLEQSPQYQAEPVAPIEEVQLQHNEVPEKGYSNHEIVEPVAQFEEPARFEAVFMTPEPPTPIAVPPNTTWAKSGIILQPQSDSIEEGMAVAEVDVPHDVQPSIPSGYLAESESRPQATSQIKTPTLVSAAMKIEALRAAARVRWREWRALRASQSTPARARDYVWQQAIPAAAGLAFAFLLGWSLAVRATHASPSATAQQSAPQTAGVTMAPSGAATVGPIAPTSAATKPMDARPRQLAGNPPRKIPQRTFSRQRYTKPAPRVRRHHRTSSSPDDYDDVVVRRFDTKPRVIKASNGVKQYSDEQD